MPKFTDAELLAKIKVGRPFVVGRVLDVQVDTLNAAQKDKDGNKIPGAPTESMPRRKTVVVSGSMVFAVTDWGKRGSTEAQLPAIRHKVDDRVMLTLQSMREDGAGFDAKGTIEVIEDEKTK